MPIAAQPPPRRTPRAGGRGPQAVRVVLAAALVLGAGGARLAEASQADPAALEAELKALRAQIVDIIGPASCANLVHCRLLPLGVRPCGGPDEYLAYGSIRTDRTRLENLAVEYGLVQEDLHRARGTAGPCVMLPAPRLLCVDNRCRTE
jgi:hypothetical protein